MQQAFTFGLKLEKDGLPNKANLFSNIGKLARNPKTCGLLKAQVREIKEDTMRAERLFDKYSDHPAFKSNAAAPKPPSSKLLKIQTVKPGSRPKSPFRTSSVKVRKVTT